MGHSASGGWSIGARSTMIELVDRKRVFYREIQIIFLHRTEVKLSQKIPVSLLKKLNPEDGDSMYHP
jgi:hypothetical protein